MSISCPSLDIAGVDARLEMDGCTETETARLEVDGVGAREKGKVRGWAFLFLSPGGCSLLLRLGRDMVGRCLEIALIGFMGLGFALVRVVALSLPFLMMLVDETAGLCGRKKGISISSYFSVLVSEIWSEISRPKKSFLESAEPASSACSSSSLPSTSMTPILCFDGLSGGSLMRMT